MWTVTKIWRGESSLGVLLWRQNSKWTFWVHFLWMGEHVYVNKDPLLDQTSIGLLWALFLTRPWPWPSKSILSLLGLHSLLFSKSLSHPCYLIKFFILHLWCKSLWPTFSKNPFTLDVSSFNFPATGHPPLSAINPCLPLYSELCLISLPYCRSLE